MQLLAHHSLGRRLLGRSARSRVVLRVEVREHIGHPVGPHLGDEDAQLRVPVEHASEQHLPQRAGGT